MGSTTSGNGSRDDASGLRDWLVEVVVTPKQGVNDPEGETIRGGLHSLGFRSIERVGAGRFLEIVLSATDADAARALATAMCSRLLANPVIESHRISVRQAQSSEPASEACG